MKEKLHLTSDLILSIYTEFGKHYTEPYAKVNYYSFFSSYENQMKERDVKEYLHLPK